VIPVVSQNAELGGERDEAAFDSISSNLRAALVRQSYSSSNYISGSHFHFSKLFLWYVP